MRWKPLGRTWSRKRLMNSLAASVIVRYRARPLTRRIARVGSETGRLMRDTGHVEGIQAVLPWHLVPLALAGCGTYTLGHHDRRKGSRTRWTRMNCARCRRR